MSEIPSEIPTPPVDPVAQAQAQAAVDQAAAQAAATAAAQKAAFDAAVAEAVAQQLQALGAVAPQAEGVADPGTYGEGIGQESDKTHAQKIEERIAALEAAVFHTDNTEGTQT